MKKFEGDMEWANKLPRRETDCFLCHYSGYCFLCSGTGSVLFTSCPQCKGTGLCKHCGGEKLVE